jgi:hypothetical protein
MGVCLFAYCIAMVIVYRVAAEQRVYLPQYYNINIQDPIVHSTSSVPISIVHVIAMWGLFNM